MRMKTTLLTGSYEGQPMVRTEGEEACLLVFRCTHDGYGFRHHQLVRTVGVQVNTREEGGLAWVGLGK